MTPMPIDKTAVLIDNEAALRLVSGACERAGSQAAFARQANVSSSLISCMLKGLRKPAPALMAALGYRKKVCWEKVR